MQQLKELNRLRKRVKDKDQEISALKLALERDEASESIHRQRRLHDRPEEQTRRSGTNPFTS